MKRRSGTAMAALGRKAGPMRHRLQPRGGASNEQEEYMAEYEESKECTLPPPGWWCSREAGHEGPCAARPTERCMLWSMGDPEGAEEHFVSPFDPPAKIRCQCPGGCPGHLQFDGPNRSNTLSFLVCDTCGHTYEAPHHK